MVRILNANDIDWSELESLFHKRGHGIINSQFQQKIIDILENPESPYEVYQCSCGEVFWISKEAAKTMIENFNSEDFPCFKCQDIKNGKFSFLILKKISTICDRLREYEMCDPLDERQKNALLNQIKCEAKGIIPTASLDEIYLGLRDVIDNIICEMNEGKIPLIGKYSPLDAIFEDCIRTCPDIFDKLTSVSKINELRTASKNSELAYVSIKGHAELIAHLKLRGISLQDNLTDYSESKTVEIEINRKMELYKNLFEEGRYYLDLLLNLIRAIEGLPIAVDPFSKHTLPTKSGKGKSINSMAERVELFNHLPQGVSLYPILKDTYDNKLRNDAGHNQYQINTQKKTIRSLKYKREISFEDLDQKINDLISLHSYINNFWRNYYPQTKIHHINNMGIEELNFGYEDSFVVGGSLFPIDYALPLLGIIQYWDFAQYENGSRYIPMPNISINNGTVTVNFENGSTITHDLDENMQYWLSHVISCNKFKIVLFTIAPLLPWFNKDSIFSIPINNLPEVNIMQRDEKYVELSDSLKGEIVSETGLGA